MGSAMAAGSGAGPRGCRDGLGSRGGRIRWRRCGMCCFARDSENDMLFTFLESRRDEILERGGRACDSPPPNHHLHGLAPLDHEERPLLFDGHGHQIPECGRAGVAGGLERLRPFVLREPEQETQEDHVVRRLGGLDKLGDLVFGESTHDKVQRLEEVGSGFGAVLGDRVRVQVRVPKRTVTDTGLHQLTALVSCRGGRIGTRCPPVKGLSASRPGCLDQGAQAEERGPEHLGPQVERPSRTCEGDKGLLGTRGGLELLGCGSCPRFGA